MLITYIKNSIYSIPDNNSNIFSCSAFETELSDFSTLKPFDMQPRKKSDMKTMQSTNVNPRTF